MKLCRSLIRVGAIAVGVTAGLWAAEIDRGASLYDRLGGISAIRAVVDDLMVRILGDPRVSPWFGRAAADPNRAAAYKANLADLVCQVTGGPCKYAGMDMVTAHKGRGVTLEAFNGMVDDVAASLDKLKVRPAAGGRVAELWSAATTLPGSPSELHDTTKAPDRGRGISGEFLIDSL